MVSSKKKFVSKNQKKALSKDASPEFCFKVVDGSELKNLMELADALDRMSDDSFYYHANAQRNDFANWVRDIFKEEKLADELTRCANRLEAETKLLRFFVNKVK